MADYGAIQPRQFIMDSSRQNGATLGDFKQNNNRYLCTLELFDNSVPVTIPAGVDIAVKCKKNSSDTIYTLDKNNPDFASKVSFTPGDNKIVVDRWGAMVAQEGQILLGVTINGISTYTVSYNVDKDPMTGKEVIHSEAPASGFADKTLSNVQNNDFLSKAKSAGLLQNNLEDIDLQKLDDKFNDTDSGKTLKSLIASTSPEALDRWLKQDPAFVALAAAAHPATSGMTPEQIKALFYANRFEIPNSAVDFTVSKAYTGAKHIQSSKFSLSVKKGDSVRMFFKADTDDGVYIQSGTGGQPLIRVNMDFEELEEIDQRIIDLINNKK